MSRERYGTQEKVVGENATLFNAAVELHSDGDMLNVELVRGLLAEGSHLQKVLEEVEGASTADGQPLNYAVFLEALDERMRITELERLKDRSLYTGRTQQELKGILFSTQAYDYVSQVVQEEMMPVDAEVVDLDLRKLARTARQHLRRKSAA